MALFNLQEVSKFFGNVEVLRNVSMQLNRGEKAGLVGANGTGKTTVLKIILGLERHDAGEVVSARGLSVGYLSQRPELAAGMTLRAYLENAAGDILNLKQKLSHLEQQMASPDERENPEKLNQLMERYGKLTQLFEQRDGYQVENRIREVAFGLGFKEEDLPRQLDSFSGGEKTRGRLAALLLQEHDLMLLDEPTNNLDMDAVQWLEKYLASWRGSLLVVSHDRFFLDSIAEKIFFLDSGQVKPYRGNYTAFAAQRSLEEKAQEKEYEKQQEILEKERRFIQTATADERTKKQARSREKRLEKIQPVNAPSSRKTMNLGFDYAGRSGEIVAALEGVSKYFGSKLVFSQVDLEVRWGDRIAIVGPNGAGKSTLLKILTGEDICTRGSVRLGSSVRMAYFDQEQRQLDPDLTLVESIMEASGMLEKEARNYLGRFLFSGDEVFKRIRDLSGGEKSRLALARTALAECNLLILDEPTNHLDIGGMEKLESTLAEYPGTLLLVSHDRYFISRVASKVLEVRDGRVLLYKEGYHQYLESKAREQEQEDSSGSSAREQARSARRLQREQEKMERQRVIEAKRQERRARQQVEELEYQVQEVEKYISDLERQLADPAVYDDFEQARQIMEELSAARERLSELLKEWEDAAEALENSSYSDQGKP